MTKWIRNIWFDLLVTLCILVAVNVDRDWMYWLVGGYTLLMIAGRTLFLLSGQLRAIVNKKKSQAPDWIYHLLYGLNVTILVLFGWFIISAGWAIIWGLAAFGEKRR